jgi:hypothetical protein
VLNKLYTTVMDGLFGLKSGNLPRIVGFIVGMVLMAQTAIGQTTYYSRASANWNVNTTWSTVGHGSATNIGTFPVAGDIAIIGGGFTVTLTAAGGTGACATLSIDNGTLNLANGFTVSTTTTVGGVSPGTLSITGTTGTKLFGGLVTINSGSIWNETVNEAITFNGGITNNGTFTAGNALHTFTNSQTLTGNLSIPSVTVNGAIGTTVTNTNTLSVSGTLTVTGATVSLLNNGNITATTALSGTGSLTQGAGAILNIAGSSGITTINATASNNTVNYTGTGQTAHNNAYYNLGLTGAGIANLPVSVTSVAGNFTVGGSVTFVAVAGLTIGGSVNIAGSFDAGTYTHTVAGDFTNNGTFSSMGLINLNGAGQTISGSATSFGALTLSGSGTKNFNVQTSVSGNLNINSGVNVNFNGLITHTTNRLYLGGYVQINGTWGSGASGATNINDTYFTGTGYITALAGNLTYFSRLTGNWNSSTTWSTVGHGSSTNNGTYPQVGDHAVIGGGVTVTIGGAENCEALFYDAGTGVTNTLLISGSNSLNVGSGITIPQMATSMVH